MAHAYGHAMRALRLVYIDCGMRDEYALHWGARALAARLRAYGAIVEHVEFDDGHMNVGYRYDVSLPRLARALSG
jgi:enterochelin esterase family protein